jgi:hypothetical protein
MKYFTFSIIFLFSILSYGQIDSTNFKKIVKTSGPFYISNNQDSIEVYFKTDNIEYSKELKYDWIGTDVSFSINNKNGKELFRRNFPIMKGDGCIGLSAEQLIFPYLGKFLFVNYTFLPSCGGCGYDGQVFGINSLGYIVAMTGIIHIDNEKPYSLENIKPIWAYLEQAQGVVKTGKCHECKPYIEAITHTGLCGLNVDNYYEISMEGIFNEKNNGKYPFFKEQVKLDDNILLRFKPEKDNSIKDTLSFYSSPHKCQVKPQMKIIRGSSILRFIDLQSNDEGLWLMIRIDGIEGYVNLREEYNKFGFQPCD